VNFFLSYDFTQDPLKKFNFFVIHSVNHLEQFLANNITISGENPDIIFSCTSGEVDLHNANAYPVRCLAHPVRHLCTYNSNEVSCTSSEVSLLIQ